MSDLIIKGMEMPKHAIKNGTDDTLYRSCVIVHPDGTAELILDSTFADMFGFEHNLNRFPLVEIPTPHGDLIDKDVLLKEYESNPEDDQKMKNISLKCYNLMTDIVGMVTENINEMPIIIEAEGGVSMDYSYGEDIGFDQAYHDQFEDEYDDYDEDYDDWEE